MQTHILHTGCQCSQVNAPCWQRVRCSSRKNLVPSTIVWLACCRSTQWLAPAKKCGWVGEAACRCNVALPSKLLGSAGQAEQRCGCQIVDPLLSSVASRQAAPDCSWTVAASRVQNGRCSPCRASYVSPASVRVCGSGLVKTHGNDRCAASVQALCVYMLSYLCFQ